MPQKRPHDNDVEVQEPSLCNCGFVFAGGGAKGAFSQGALEALSDSFSNRFSLTVVAGASIGGLNAIVTASGKHDQAGVIWSELSPFDLLSGIPLLRTLPHPLFSALNIIFVLLLSGPAIIISLLIDVFTGRSDYLRRRGVPTTTLFIASSILIFAGSLLLMSLLAWNSEMQFLPALFATVAVASHSNWRAFYGPQFTMIFVTGFVVFGVWSIFNPQMGSAFGAWIQIGVLTIFWLVLFAVYRRTTALLSRTKLETLVAPFVQSEISIPTFVSLAKLNEEVIDWKNHRNQFIDVPRHPMEPVAPYTGLAFKPVKRYEPVYFDLQINDDPRMRSTLLAGTAALPLGLFAPVKVDDESYEDGGLADNLPLLPLLASESDIDTVVVFHIDPLVDDDGVFVDFATKKGQITAVSVLEEKLSVALQNKMQASLAPRVQSKLGITGWVVPKMSDHEGADKAKVSGHVEAEKSNLEVEFEGVWRRFDALNVLSIGPSEPLGGEVFGMLNFFQRVTRRHRQQGRAKASEILHRFDPIPVTEALKRKVRDDPSARS